jgi:hypothetical protein
MENPTDWVHASLIGQSTEADGLGPYPFEVDLILVVGHGLNDPS